MPRHANWFNLMRRFNYNIDDFPYSICHYVCQSENLRLSFRKVCLHMDEVERIERGIQALQTSLPPLVEL